MEAAEGGIAWCAERGGHILGRRTNLRLGRRVCGDGGGTETGDSEREDEKADNVILHDVSP